MIRFAVPEDLSRVNVLRKQVNDLHVEHRPDVFKAGFGQEIADVAAAYMQQEDADVIVCERDGEILGFAMIRYRERPESVFGMAMRYVEVSEFGVDTDHQRQGIGRELMQGIKEHAMLRGYRRVELNMWSFNEGALAFYEQEGFGTYRRYMEWYADEQNE